MNAPLEQAQHLIANEKDPLKFVINRMNNIHRFHRSKAKNKEIRFWKKVKQQILNQ